MDGGSLVEMVTSQEDTRNWRRERTKLRAALARVEAN